MSATEILLESKTARDGHLTKVTHESAADTLSKAKALVFALWQGTGAATTEQMADYYEVPADTLRKVLKRHRDELDSDGVKVLRGNVTRIQTRYTAFLLEVDSQNYEADIEALKKAVGKT